MKVLQKCIIKAMYFKPKRYPINLYKEAIIFDIRQFKVLELLKFSRNKWILMPVGHCYVTRGRTNENINYSQAFKKLCILFNEN